MGLFLILGNLVLKVFPMSRKDEEAKNARKLKRLKKKTDRKQNNRVILQRVIIACEGTVTEVNYFQNIFHELIQNRGISKTSLVIAKHSHTDPKGVLNDLTDALKKDSDFEHKWIVIDRDEVIKELKKYIPDYEKKSQMVYKEILPMQKIAIVYVKRLIQYHSLDDKILSPESDNPSTTVYELVELLNSF